MKNYFKNVFKNIKALIKNDKSILAFPILCTAVAFLQHIMNVNWDISWIVDFNVWATSFITSLFLYMLLDVMLERIKFFSKFKKIKTIFSFVISTFIGEAIKYSLRDNIEWWHYLIYGVLAVIFGLLLIFIMGVGVEIGKDKANIRIRKEMDDYKSEINNMTKEEKDQLVHYAKKALRIDNKVFEFIAIFKDKEAIKQIIEDIKQQ